MKRVATWIVGSLLVLLGLGVIAGFAFALFGPKFFTDPQPPSVIIRNERSEPVIVFLCEPKPRISCSGRHIAGRSTAFGELPGVSADAPFDGDITVADDRCTVFGRDHAIAADDFAIVVTADGLRIETTISPYSERYAPGFSVGPGWLSFATCEGIG